MSLGNKTIWLQYAISALTMGLVPIGIKLVDAYPLSIGIMRLSIGLCCFLFIPKTFLLIKKIKKPDILPLCSLGFLFFLHWISYFYSIKISTPVTAVLGLSTYGIHLLIMSIIFQGKKAKAMDLIALVLAFIGVIIISPEFSFSNNTFLGLSIGIGSAAFFASLPIIHQANKHIDDNLRSFFMLLGALLCFLLTLITFDSPDLNFKIEKSDWVWYLFLGAGGTFISHLLWTKVSSYFPANLTSVIYYGYIPITMIYSSFILPDKTSVSEIVGGGLIILGGILAVNDFRKQSKLEVGVSNKIPLEKNK